LIKDWRKYLLETTGDSDDIFKVKRSSRTGRPAGNHDFVKKIEKLTGRALQKQKPGPKKMIDN
jgi:putative transposase